MRTPRQLETILLLTGSKTARLTRLPDQHRSAPQRLLQLGFSIVSYVHGFFKQGMVISGDGAVWGKGAISIRPRLGPFALLRELLHGRSVIFIRNDSQSPYEQLAHLVDFDEKQGSMTSLLNDNSCLTLSGEKNGTKIFAHIGRGPAGQRTIRRHTEGLSHARAALMDNAILRSIAQPLQSHDEREISVLTQTWLPGRRIHAYHLNDKTFGTTLKSACAPLVEIHKATAQAQPLPEQDYLRQIRDHLPRIENEPAAHALVQHVLQDIESWMQTRQPQSVLVHGDYGLQNLLFNENPQVTAIADWEWIRAQGCAGYDAIHLIILAYADKEKLDIAATAAMLSSSNDLPPQLDIILKDILPDFGLSREDVIPLAKLVWLTIIFRSGIWTDIVHNNWLQNTIAPMQAIYKEAKL